MESRESSALSIANADTPTAETRSKRAENTVIPQRVANSFYTSDPQIEMPSLLMEAGGLDDGGTISGIVTASPLALPVARIRLHSNSSAMLVTP